MQISAVVSGWLKQPLTSVISADRLLTAGSAWFRPASSLRSLEQRSEMVRYHLGRGRRARERGDFAAGAREAGRAIALNPGAAWAYSLLGQCLANQRQPDLVGARRALERACALEPSNAYFVGLLVSVLERLGDSRGREDALTWSWWNGAPVERWLPDGPPQRAGATVPAPRRAERAPAMPATRIPVPA